MIKILVSACLMGESVRYDGDHNRIAGDVFETWQNQGRLVSVCPEVAGGLSVPRPAVQIVGGDGEDVLDDCASIRTESGTDVTDSFVLGAEYALSVARAQRVGLAILKERSPSCGGTQIYDGSFTKQLAAGRGVTAALLERNGIAVFSEERIAEAAAFLEQLEKRL